VGRERETELILMVLLAEGHALLEGVPGVAKTLLAKSFARCMGLDFRRVQFTPDMLPLDIVGGFIFDMKERDFEFRKGPIFTNILLADEINRAPPKVQSALLEAMQERQVTVDGHTVKLPSPLMVIATQNPIEFQGVYPLPEGQLDRFMMKVTFGYPALDTESSVVRLNLYDGPAAELHPVVTSDELAHALASVKGVRLTDEMLDYLARIAQETRSDKQIRLGLSPRATVQLARCAQARAFLLGRDYVTPDDVKELSDHVFSHRLILDQSAVMKGVETDPSKVVRSVLDRVTPPR